MKSIDLSAVPSVDSIRPMIDEIKAGPDGREAMLAQVIAAVRAVKTNTSALIVAATESFEESAALLGELEELLGSVRGGRQN